MLLSINTRLKRDTSIGTDSARFSDILNSADFVESLMKYLILFYHDEHIVVYDDPCRNVYDLYFVSMGLNKILDITRCERVECKDRLPCAAR
jgi:hypothetical protein